MALLVEGLGIGGETSIEEYIIGPADELSDEPTAEKDQMKLYGPEEGLSWIAKPVTGQSSLGLVSRYGTLVNQSVPLIDPLVTLFAVSMKNSPRLEVCEACFFQILVACSVPQSLSLKMNSGMKRAYRGKVRTTHQKLPRNILGKVIANRAS